MCSNWVIFRAAWAGAQFPEMHIEWNFGRSCGTGFLMSLWTSEYCLNCGLKKHALMCGLYFGWADGNYMWGSRSAEWKSAQWALSENKGLIWEVCSLVGMLSSNLRGLHFCMWVLTFCSSGYAFKLWFERVHIFADVGFWLSWAWHVLCDVPIITAENVIGSCSAWTKHWPSTLCLIMSRKWRGTYYPLHSI